MALFNGFVGVRADDTTGNCAEGADTHSEGVDERAVEAGGGVGFGIELAKELTVNLRPWNVY